VGILIFKGLNARRLYKLFSVKGLKELVEIWRCGEEIECQFRPLQFLLTLFTVPLDTLMLLYATPRGEIIKVFFVDLRTISDYFQIQH
jgi:hypothetical protein